MRAARAVAWLVCVFRALVLAPLKLIFKLVFHQSPKASLLWGTWATGMLAWEIWGGFWAPALAMVAVFYLVVSIHEKIDD